MISTILALMNDGYQFSCRPAKVLNSDGHMLITLKKGDKNAMRIFNPKERGSSLCDIDEVIERHIDLLLKDFEPSEIIAVDFDGTLCENKWPEIGRPNWDIIRYLRGRQEDGAKLILWSCRSGEKLEDAVDWCIKRGLVFDAVNENLPESIEHFGEDTRKIYATEYIDDKSCTKFKLPFKA